MLQFLSHILFLTHKQDKNDKRFVIHVSAKKNTYSHEYIQTDFYAVAVSHYIRRNGGMSRYKRW